MTDDQLSTILTKHFSNLITNPLKKYEIFNEAKKEIEEYVRFSTLKEDSATVQRVVDEIDFNKDVLTEPYNEWCNVAWRRGANYAFREIRKLLVKKWLQ